jgi:hypothetical protein
MNRLRSFSFVLILFFSSDSFGQAIKALEKDLVSTFIAQRAYHDSIDEIIRHDSVRANLIFNMTHIDSLCQNKMIYYTSKFPQTIGMDFKLLRTQDVYIISSDDSLFRIYVWNERRCMGTPVYKSVFQYKTGDDVKSCLLPHSDTTITGASLGFYDAIYTLTANDKTYYLATYLNRYKPNFREEGLKIFTIEKGKLNDTAHLIKTKTGLHNELSYKYDVAASGDAGSDNGIVFDTAEVTIQIPVILEENSKMTSRQITYKFTGQYFEKVEATKKEKEGE